MASIRYIHTDDLPLGFDVGDLIEQGTTGQALIDWCKARVRDGVVPPESRPAAVAPRPATTPPPAPKEKPQPPGRTDGAVIAAVGRGIDDKPTIPVGTVSNAAVAVLPVAPPQAAPAADEHMLPPEYSDDALAREFTRQFSGTFLYVSEWGRWLQWDGCRWKHDNTLAVTDAIRTVMREQSESVRHLHNVSETKRDSWAKTICSIGTNTAVERFAKSDRKHAAEASQFDADEWALNTPAGIVDLRNGTIRQAGMRDYCTKISRVAPGGDCPRWKQFLYDTTDGNEEMMHYLQRVAGYALTGSTREHALFFFYGTGRNGKGTFLNTLEWIMGDYSKVASMDTFTESKNERHSTDLAALMGARLVTSQETDEGKRWAEARIKSMTGGDPITARFMRQDDFTYTPQFKLMISGNHRPGLRNVDEAMRARLHLIPFTITVPIEKRDPMLAHKLKAEAAGILQWAIEGCKEWDRIRLAPPLVVRKATDEYFGSQDIVGQWLAEECELGLGNRVAPAIAYNSFMKFCAQSGEYSMPRRRWLDALELKGVKPGRTGAGRFLAGLRLRPNVDEGDGEMF